MLVGACARAPTPVDAGPPANARAALVADAGPPAPARAPVTPLSPLSLLPASDPRETLREGFFVYGFSKDAKLAFVETKVEDGKGETTYRLVIHDLRDDVLVEELVWTASSVLDAIQLEPFLAIHRDGVSALLDKHRIEGAPERLEPVFTHDGATLRVVLSGADDKPTTEERVRSVVLVRQPGDFEKKIGTVLEKGIAGMPVLYGSKPLAVLRSPFEARAAIVIVTTVRGFEGPPNGRLVTVLGADLERGFVR